MIVSYKKLEKSDAPKLSYVQKHIFRSLSAWFLTKERRQKPKNYMVKYFKLLSHFIHKLRKIRFTNTAKWQKWHFLLILSIFYRSLRFFKSKQRATYDYLYDPLTWCKKLEKSNAEISRYVQIPHFWAKNEGFCPKWRHYDFFTKIRKCHFLAIIDV